MRRRGRRVRSGACAVPAPGYANSAHISGSTAQAEIDKPRNDRHAAHDADGNLSLEAFAGRWREIGWI